MMMTFSQARGICERYAHRNQCDSLMDAIDHMNSNIESLSVQELEALDVVLAEMDTDYGCHEDDGYALASAGFGTDEDYGYYGEE